MIADQMSVLASGTGNQDRPVVVALLGYAVGAAFCADAAGEGHFVGRHLLSRLVWLWRMIGAVGQGSGCGLEAFLLLVKEVFRGVEAGYEGRVAEKRRG